MSDQSQVLKYDGTANCRQAFAAWRMGETAPRELWAAADVYEIDHRNAKLRVSFAGYEQRDLSVDNPVKGGYLAPAANLSDAIVMRKQRFDAAARFSTIIQDESLWPLLIPKIDSTAQALEAQLQTPNNRSAEPTADASLSQATLYGDRCWVSPFILMSMRLARTPAGEQTLGLLTGESLGRGQGRAHVLGSPSGPGGILEQATAGITGSAPTAMTKDDVLNLTESVDEAHRLNGAFLMKSATFSAITKLVDGQGLPQVPFTIGRFPTLFNFPVFLSPHMPAAASGAKSILFGDLSANWIRQSGVEYQRLIEGYLKSDGTLEELAAKGMIAFTATQYCDSTLSDTEAVRYLVHP